MLLAKEALMEPIDITDLIARGPSNRAEELRLELYEKVNALGIGAQGLGGLTTVLDVKVKDYPTHAANQLGRAHVRTPVTHAHLVCRLLLDKQKHTIHSTQYPATTVYLAILTHLS